VRVGFWIGKLKDREHLKDPDVDGIIILRWIVKKWDGDMEWVYLARDRDGRRALVNSIMTFQVL
jgi:hypothetical protein